MGGISRGWSIPVICLLVSALFAPPPQAAADPPARDKRIVVLKDHVASEAVPRVSRRIVQDARSAMPSLRFKQYDTSPGRQDVVFRHALKGFAVRLSPEDGDLIELLKSHPDVAYVAEDLRGELHAQLFQPGMERIRVRNNALTAINGVDDVSVDVDIAILDTGIDSGHPDLDVYQSVSFVTGDLTPVDGHGHGTHVAGIAAAVDDDDGVYGTAPGARLWAIKVVDATGFVSMSDLLAGLDYVMANADQIDVVNMSLGFSTLSDDGNCGATNADPLHQAICAVVDAGVVVVASAGNSVPYGHDASLLGPASYDEVITVSAVVETDGLGPGAGQGAGTIYGPDNSFAGTFSNYGWDVDIAAPGVDVISTWPGGGYLAGSGTSAAAPHVAGAAALWIARYGKPIDRQQVLHVRDELVRLAFPQFGADEGFSGDKDTYMEPLLNVAALDPGVFDPVEPQLITDKPVYEYLLDSEAVVTVQLKNELGLPLEGLPNNGFVAYLDGRQEDVAFEDLGQGDYALTLNIEGLDPGNYGFTAFIRNASGFERSAGCRILVHDVAPRVVIRQFAFSWQVMGPDWFFDENPLLTILTDESGAPLVIPTSGLQTMFSGGGPPLAWSFPPPDHVSGVSSGITYGAYQTEVSNVSSLPLGTYYADLVVTHGARSSSAAASFELATPDPRLTAELSSNLSMLDFTQIIPPPDLDLRVRVESEWSTGVPALPFLVDDPFVVKIDGQIAPDPGFAGIRRAAGTTSLSTSQPRHSGTVRTNSSCT